MKKTLLVIICLLFLFPLSIGQSAEVGKVDGYKWAQMSREMKLGFVIGWINGGSAIVDKVPLSYIFIASVVYQTNPKINYPKINKITIGVSKEVGVELYDLAFGQIVDMVDKVYSDPRVKTWEIYDIMPLVRGRLKEGWTEKDLDEVIAYMIKEKEHIKKLDNIESMSQSESEKLDKEIRQLEVPKVLKVLRAYQFE